MRTLRFHAPLSRPPIWRFFWLSLFASTWTFAGPPRVGMIIMNREMPFWAAIERAGQDAAQANGVELIVKSLPNQNSAIEERLIAGMASQSLDAIIVAPLDTTTVSPALQELAAKHVKIIALRYPLAGNVATTTVELDEAGISRAGAEMLANAITDADEVAVFRSADRSGTGFAPRDRDAIAAVRAAHPKTIVDADIFVGDVGQEAAQIDALLAAHPHVTAIYTSRPFFTNAVRDALKAKGLAGKIKHIAIGVGLPGNVIDDLDHGILAGWVGENSAELGRKAVEATAGILKGQATPAVVTASFVAVTPKTDHGSSVAALLEK